MSDYTIAVTREAMGNITDIRNYIAREFSTPKTAERYAQAVIDAIADLSFMPTGIALIDEEPWCSQGLRRILVKNFIYFRVDEEASTVYIVDVVYARRDQRAVLEDVDSDAE